MSYIGNEPIVSATRTVTEITATAGQTTFTANGGYTVGYIDVFVNGAQLQTSDFTATNGTSITLNSPAVVGDDIRLVAWGTFSSANITSGSLSAGGITWSQSGGVTLPRIDSSNEGGQLNFNRASDNTATWSIDSFGNTSTPSLRFVDGANVRAVIDGSGNVGIGTSSPATFGKFAVVSADGFNSGFSGVTTTLTNYIAGDLVYLCAGPSSGSNGKSLVFQTGNSGLGSERMRIDSLGSLLINTTSNGYGVTGGIYAPSVHGFTTASAANMFIESGGFMRRSTSSIKYKTDVQDATHGLSDVMKLRSVTYKGLNDGDKVFGGLIAEEVHDAGLTEFVQYAEDGTPDALAYGQMVSLLAKAIQELKTIVDNQKIELDNAKAEIELLKGAN